MKNLLIFSFLFSLVCSHNTGSTNLITMHTIICISLAIAMILPLLEWLHFWFPEWGKLWPGKPVEGFCFFVDFILSYSIALSSAIDMRNQPIEDRKIGAGAYIGLAGSLVTWIWSITDAVKVAKVNNLAYRDKNKVGLNNFSPVLIQNPNNGQLTGGLSFKLRLD